MSIFTVIEQAKRRDDVVPEYAKELRAWRNAGYPPFDWSEINQAIIDRWSRAGLKYIKKQAWLRIIGEDQDWLRGVGEK